MSRPIRIPDHVAALAHSVKLDEPGYATRVAELEARFGGRMLEQATRYLSTHPVARRLTDPGDLVNSLWAAVLGAFARSETGNPIREEPLHYLARSMTRQTLNLARERRRHLQPLTHNVGFPDPGAEQTPQAARDRFVERDPERTHISTQRIGLLRDAIAALPPHLKEVLTLRTEGCSVKEISAMTGVREGAVKSRLVRARQSVARYVRERETLPKG